MKAFQDYLEDLAPDVQSLYASVDAYIAAELNRIDPTGSLARFRRAVVDMVMASANPLVAAYQGVVDDIRAHIPEHQPGTVGAALVKTLLNDENVRTAGQRAAARGIYRLIENGGIWEGKYVVDWLDRHLRARMPGGQGSGADGVVLFRDLPMDLCVVAVDVGRVGADFVSHPHQTLYFSKKTTPDYPVGEAVRRSMTLPFVFYPRKINEGDGNNPPDVTTSGRFGGGRVPRDYVRTVVDYRRHHNAVLLDGGFRVNLPVAVFRDPSSVYMDNEFANGEPVKYVVSYNLNDLKNAPERPAAVPPPQLPSPLNHLVQSISEVLPEPAEPLELSDGLKRLVLSGGQTLDLMTGAGREDEQRDLLALVPKSLLVDIGTRDPNADRKDHRFSGLDFGAPKVTKKWMCHSGWAAGAATLQKLAAGSGLAIGLDAAVDPYGHALAIDEVSRPGYVPDLQRPASFIPNARYSTDRDFRATPERAGGRPLPLGAGAGSHYVGMGAFWLRTRDADRENRDDTFLSFRVNRPCRILLLTDPQAVLPGFVRNDPEWDEDSRVLGTTDLRVGVLRVMFRDFPAGTIRLGGPRSNGGDGNRCQYAILVQAR